MSASARFQTSIQSTFDVERASKASIERFASFARLVQPKASVLGFAADLKARGISTAVATNAERSVAEISLTAAQAAGLFDHLVSISNAVAPKPSPEMFVLAAERLVQPRNKVLVVEDSPQGVEAALEADMSVLQLV